MTCMNVVPSSTACLNSAVVVNDVHCLLCENVGYDEEMFAPYLFGVFEMSFHLQLHDTLNGFYAMNDGVTADITPDGDDICSRDVVVFCWNYVREMFLLSLVVGMAAQKVVNCVNYSGGSGCLNVLIALTVEITVSQGPALVHPSLDLFLFLDYNYLHVFDADLRMIYFLRNYVRIWLQFSLYICDIFQLFSVSNVSCTTD